MRVGFKRSIAQKRLFETPSPIYTWTSENVRGTLLIAMTWFFGSKGVRWKCQMGPSLRVHISKGVLNFWVLNRNRLNTSFCFLFLVLLPLLLFLNYFFRFLEPLGCPSLSYWYSFMSDVLLLRGEVHPYTRSIQWLIQSLWVNIDGDTTHNLYGYLPTLWICALLVALFGLSTRMSIYSMHSTQGVQL